MYTRELHTVDSYVLLSKTTRSSVFCLSELKKKTGFRLKVHLRNEVAPMNGLIRTLVDLVSRCLMKAVAVVLALDTRLRCAFAPMQV